jgi:hypothetical protein
MQRPTPSQPQLAPASGAPWAPWLVAFALAGLLGLRFSFVIAGAASDFVDFEALHADKLVFERPDTRLNAWILAWVDHTALRAPAELYHGNIHHPERHVLTGSEHLFGIALQLLPFEPFVDGAIARHQLALVLSSALLMATSFWAVHWATGSVWAAALAAAFALGMPWRVSEISHLQLVSAQWLPLVWLGVVRGLLGDTRAPTLALLGVAVGLQLLSSFYLAYFMTLSCAVLVATVVWMRLPRAQHVLRLALAVAPGYALFVASALPYLARQADAGLGALYDPSLPIAPREVLAVLAPRWPWTFELPNEPASYWTPWAIVLLAAIGAAAAFRGERGSPLQALSAGLVGIVVLALVMMLGGGVELAGATIPTPGRLLAEILPGFELLRGPTRWGILAACALPLLAGLGVHALDGLAERRASARVAVALASAATFAWFALPTAPAWEHPGIIEQRYEALAALPPGPLLELPWPTDAGDIEQGSRSVLASALHWRPTLNGYTGHRPRSYRFVQRIAERLPTRRSLEQLQRLTGLRFALLDPATLALGSRRGFGPRPQRSHLAAHAHLRADCRRVRRRIDRAAGRSRAARAHVRRNGPRRARLRGDLGSAEARNSPAARTDPAQPGSAAHPERRQPRLAGLRRRPRGSGPAPLQLLPTRRRPRCSRCHARDAHRGARCRHCAGRNRPGLRHAAGSAAKRKLRAVRRSRAAGRGRPSASAHPRGAPARLGSRRRRRGRARPPDRFRLQASGASAPVRGGVAG